MIEGPCNNHLPVTPEEDEAWDSLDALEGVPDVDIEYQPQEDDDCEGGACKI